MILRTRQISNNINRQLRKEIAMTYRLMKRCLFKKGISETEQFDQHQPSIGKGLLVWVGLMAGSILFWVGMGLVIIGLLISISPSKAHADEIPDQKAIKCIIGEAEDQGFEGMLAIAHAIRNRQTLKGCYGLHAYRVTHHLYSRGIENSAELAWEQSSYDFDITHGATGWGNIQDFKKFEMCRWWKNCIVTTKIKYHIFYKEKS